MLRDDDWTERALVTPTRTAQQVLDAMEPGAQTALVDNASMLSKQAGKYSNECGVVLLCNYQNMIALDFHTSPDNAPWDDLNHPVKYFWSDGTAIPHKRLLIAALVYGMKKVGLMAANGELSLHHLESEH